MEQYAMYLRKSRFDRDYAELSVEETLKRHKAILDRTAEERGYYIAQIYYEVVSGESIAARPEIQKLLEAVGNELYAGVLVVDLERLARGNSADQAYISQVFQFSSTKIITPAKTYDPNNEYDEDFFEFGLFMSRREYKTINRRLLRGRDSSASEGKYISSIAPYGYQKKKLESEKGFTLEPDPEEADVVKKIFQMFLQHNGTKTIANYLNDQKIPTRHGDLWTYSTISNIVTNPVYAGKIRRGWSKQVKSMEDGVVKKHIKRNKNYGDYPVYGGLHPALISEEIFLRAQEIRLEKSPVTKVKGDFELQNTFAGLLFCKCCGKRISRTTLAASQNHRVRLRCVNARNCHNSSSDCDVVEEEIVNALRLWFEGYKVKIDTVGYADDIKECNAQIKRFQQEIDKLNAQLTKAFNLVEQGIYTLELFQQRRNSLTSSIADARDRQLQAEKLLLDYEENETSRNSLIPQTTALLECYEEMSISERNAILKTILEKIEYRKGKNGNIEIDLYPKLPKK